MFTRVIELNMIRLDLRKNETFSFLAASITYCVEYPFVLQVHLRASILYGHVLFIGTLMGTKYHRLNTGATNLVHLLSHFNWSENIPNILVLLLKGVTSYNFKQAMRDTN